MYANHGKSTYSTRIRPISNGQIHYFEMGMLDKKKNLLKGGVCVSVEVLWPSQPTGVMLSVVRFT